MLDFESIGCAGTTMLALDAVPSTNDIAIDAARAGAEHGWSVRARVQTAGRGRRGHFWTSPQGGLFLSIVLRPGVPMQMLMGLPAVTSLGVLDALEGLGLSGRIGVKWPNDIVVAPREARNPKSSQINRKIAGILVEARSSETGAFAVAGIGINIIALGDAPPAPPEIQAAIDAVQSVRRQQGHGAEEDGIPPLEPSSLVEALPDGAELPTPGQIAESVRTSVLARVERWERAIDAGLGKSGPLAPIHQSYVDALPMLGKPVSVLGQNGSAIGVGYFVDIDPWGRAVVKLGSGEERLFSAEVVSIREI